ncbi:MAG: hypothetical protein QGG84_10520 [Rhodospirillales bacterium]|nr:hypothetical protein [Rhodospirillales bacterium]
MTNSTTRHAVAFRRADYRAVMHPGVDAPVCPCGALAIHADHLVASALRDYAVELVGFEVTDARNINPLCGVCHAAKSAKEASLYAAFESGHVSAAVVREFIWHWAPLDGIGRPAYFSGLSAKAAEAAKYHSYLKRRGRAARRQGKMRAAWLAHSKAATYWREVFAPRAAELDRVSPQHADLFVEQNKVYEAGRL